MRIILVGAVDSTRIALETLVRGGTPPVALVTLPRSLSGRHSDFVDFHPITAALGVPLVEVRNVNDASAIAKMRALEPDYCMVIGWSQICGEEFRGLPRLGCVGYHPAPLPQDRGRAVIPWTILQNRAETGSTLFWLDEGVDSGDILIQERYPVSPTETAATLYQTHLDALERLMEGMMTQLRAGKAPRVVQDHHLANYCAKRTADDGWIDWTQPATDVWRLIRAVGKPYPGAFTLRKEQRLTVWEADYVGQAPYVGLPGQVQAIDASGVLVQCGDRNHVRLVQVAYEGNDVAANELLKNHEKLGLDWAKWAVTIARRLSE
ncbi:formyltransferase family protein [Singulisphaera sp. Ch08]|uniref:Formyltransferase family protein n=1 Tax=Singulisphaera sp. Ch08 TaxID=3120278 RepID=A0AAU7CMB5_9BACT